MNILLASSLRASKTFCERVLFFGATYIHCESIQVQFNILSQEEAFLQSKVQNMAHDVKKTWCSKVVQTLNSTREIETSFTFLRRIFAPLSYTLGAIMVSTEREFTFWEPLLRPLDGRGYRCFNLRIRFFEGKPRRHEIPSECTSPGGGKNFTS